MAANEAAVRHWSDAVAAGGRASLLFPEDTRETFGALESAVLTKGEPATFSWGQQGPAGIRSWFTSSVSPLGAGAQVIGYLCISSDVTELKRSEQRFRRSEELLVDTQGVAHLGTWEWDVTEPTAVWSAELYRIYGLRGRRAVRRRRADFAPRQNGIITFCPWRRSSLWTTTRRS